MQLQNSQETVGTKKVAVTLPFNTVVAMAEAVVTVPVEQPKVAQAPVVEKEIEKEIYVLDLVSEEPEEEEVASSQHEEPVSQGREYSLRKPLIQESLFEEPRQKAKEEPRPTYSAQQLFNSAFESTMDVPTLSQYGATAEVHEKIAERKESLNDRLKREQTEVAQVLKETPIKDLRKGIGINDRFVFVRELFRGDEAAYERSIKTINNFNIYSEAEYWMSRELRLKLGWNDDNETAKHFYQLVRRRFS